MARAVGIDLGTTNSVVSILEAGEPNVIPNAEGARTTPSVVGFAKNGEILVGEVAKRQAITNPDRTVRSVKRHMGPRIGPSRSTGSRGPRRRVGADPRQAQAGRRGLPRRHGHRGRHHRSRVLRRLAAAGDQGGRADRRARGPAHHQRADRRGARLRARQEAADETILVFDLGGGTFDVSLLEIGDGVFEVKATHGDTQLGGDDWDQRIIDWLVREFKNNHGVDLAQDRMALQRLKEAAEKAKIELSQVTRDDDQPAVHHGDGRRPAAPRDEALAQRVRADDRRPRRAVHASRSSWR